MKWLISGLTVLLVALQYELWFDAEGFRGVKRLESAIQMRTLENARLMERNNALIAEVNDLREGYQAVEEYARHDLGMIQRGETFYKIVDVDSKAAASLLND